jgi:two-component system, sensor histidine kinase RpfC
MVLKRIWTLMSSLTSGLTQLLIARLGTTNLVARARGPEFEQALLRVTIGGLVLVYLAVHVYGDRHVTQDEAQVLWVAIGFFAFAIALSAEILVSPSTSVARRYLGMIADNAVTSYCLIATGEPGAVIIGVYLFVTFGNGFRYGRAYLHACQVMSLMGFGAVILLSDFWRANASLSVGIAISMLVLPFYVGVLAQRITEARKRADEANQAKGRFVANVSHEMRTPLNGVIAMADILRESRLDESQEEIVETLSNSANLLLTQIEDVLDMAKIESGRVQIEQRPFDMGHLLSSTLKIVLPQARLKGLVVDTDIAPNVARWFSGDSHHLRQVLLNLLANAVKFTVRGGIVLRATQVNGDAAMARVRIEVEDTGIGIPSSKQSAIFEPFTQADDSITRLYGGTGLGTTIARQLVNLMGGQIGLTSVVGHGTCFWFELPLRLAESSATEAAIRPTSSPNVAATLLASATRQPSTVTKLRGARILVAEDNPTNQRVAQLILESDDHRVTIVSDGEAALDALEHGNFDIALFDLSMPILSGVEALKLYRFSTSSPIPVLILSANVTTDVIGDCERAGAAAFIAKPLRAPILLDAIDRQLAARGAADIQLSTPTYGNEERRTLTVVETPAIDQSVLEDLGRLSTDPTFIERLIHGFCSDTERLVKMIAEGLAARRFQDVKDAAHSLKGAAGSVGATQLVALALRFEQADHAVMRLKAAAWTAELSRAVANVLGALELHLEERRHRQSRSS